MKFSIHRYFFLLRQSICTLFSLAGYGWLTIEIKNVHAYGLADGSGCDVSSSCDPYVKFFIDGEKVMQTDAKQNTCCYDANAMYQSIKIPKKSAIKIEVWDDDSGFFGTADDLIMQTQGTIESFMKTSIRVGSVFDARRNSIETISFWQDEYK